MTIAEQSLSSEPNDRVSSQKTVAFYTLGCKANQLESSTLANTFSERGWAVVPFDEAASVYVVNTCTVTERSDRESQRILRRARLSNPKGQVVMTGCYAQVAPDEVAALDGVVLWHGPLDLRRAYMSSHPPRIPGLVRRQTPVGHRSRIRFRGVPGNLLDRRRKDRNR